MILNCVRVDTFDNLGRVEEESTLVTPARLDIAVGRTDDVQTEDSSALEEASEWSRVRLLYREGLGEEWSEIASWLNWDSVDGSSISVTRDRFGVFLLIADLEPPDEAMIENGGPVSAPAITPMPAPMVEDSVQGDEHSGAAFGPLIATLATYLIMLWYMRMLGMRH